MGMRCSLSTDGKGGQGAGGSAGLLEASYAALTALRGRHHWPVRTAVVQLCAFVQLSTRHREYGGCEGLEGQLGGGDESIRAIRCPPRSQHTASGNPTRDTDYGSIDLSTSGLGHQWFSGLAAMQRSRARPRCDAVTIRSAGPQQTGPDPGPSVPLFPSPGLVRSSKCQICGLRRRPRRSR